MQEYIGILSVFLFASFINLPTWSEDSSLVYLHVDAREAPRKIFHARMTMPATPGPLTLLYPKWIPGEHGPTGPISDLAGLQITAGGKPIAWRRDSEDMYAFHCEVPPAVNSIEVKLDYLSPTGQQGFTSAASATEKLAGISWQHLLLYPKGAAADELRYALTVEFPRGWKFGTSLRPAKQSPDRIEFRPASLTTLVDSPMIAGEYFRTLRLNSDDHAPIWMHIVADSEEALNIKEEFLMGYRKLAQETLALFGTRHYEEYHFLVTLSDNVAHFGLEHHESSDNRGPEKMMTNAEVHKIKAGLLPHELVHSWNAKYRRPSGLLTSDFHNPMKGDLLWVYEGLTTYLGHVLAARSGLWSPQDYRDKMAMVAAEMSLPGRTWRPVLDTAIAAQILFETPTAWKAWRRRVDFYPEGDLIWLEADVTIRKLTGGKKSLDDFCRLFHGGENTPPMVKTYTFEDLVSALNQIAPHDWKSFFENRLNSTRPEPPLGGIEESGWKLAFTDQRSAFQKDWEEEQKEDQTDMNYSIGIWLDKEGLVKDVVPDSASAKAGIGPGMKLIAVNGRRFTPTILRAGIRAAKDGKKPLELLVENLEFFQTYRLDYKAGERYPNLVRDSQKPDLLEKIISPKIP